MNVHVLLINGIPIGVYSNKNLLIAAEALAQAAVSRYPIPPDVAVEFSEKEFELDVFNADKVATR